MDVSDAELSAMRVNPDLDSFPTISRRTEGEEASDQQPEQGGSSDTTAAGGHRPQHGRLTDSHNVCSRHVLGSSDEPATTDPAPAAIAVCKCPAHTGGTDPISAGNTRADAAAKAAARHPLPFVPCLLSSTSTQPPSPPSALPDLQTFSTPQECKLWLTNGATSSHGVWYGPDGKPCLPKHFFPHFAKLTHGLDHVSKGAMLDALTKHWYTKGFSIYAQKYCEACMTCAQHNPGKTTAKPLAAHPPPEQAFDHLMLDFIELTPAEGKKYCLVIVDMWSKWVEAFPAKHANSHAVTKALLTEIIPRWGIPSKISSDNGSHFANQALEEVGKFLNIDIR
ncbi:uncharacterized protein LOC129605103 isoform X2 [Betta splendens]|uniref:Uncharacterized protein LOC129605103 isoform X2 n=1 Tax=Betta splendens TaxID=158456 RepID=A0A9W2Y917_BETSP|nr:uncharacterized protein LOC129605103 isoform X2 [Betta splendens]